MPRLLRATILLALLLVSGCTAVPGQAPWGSRVDFRPGWDRLGRASLAALKDPLTWGPAAGALAFSIGDLDREASDWARTEQPLFNGQAETASDWLLGGSLGLYLGSALLADSGTTDSWRINKARGLGVGLTANLATAGLTYGIKETTGRTRPDATDRESFPSGHSSLAATNAALAAENLAHLPLAPSTRGLLRGTGHAVAWGTAWARIEAGRHYPSDVLAGLALGNLVARIALLSLDATSPLATGLDLQLTPERLLVGLHGRF